MQRHHHHHRPLETTETTPVYKSRASPWPNQIHWFSQRRSMKAIIIFSLAAATLASLEPSSYRAPGSDGPSDHYLPPDHGGSSPVLTPESHYLPTNYQSPPQNVIPNSQYLPSNHGPASPHGSVVAAIPSAQYLPTRQQPHSSASPPSSLSSHHHVGAGHQTPSPNFAPTESGASQYLPPNQRPDTFTQTIPSSNYLPPNQYSKELINQAPVTSTYLMPNKFTGQLSGFSSQSKNQYTGYHTSKSMPQASQYYPASGYPSQDFAGYPSDQAPAKYEFEYHVNDEFGNDYSHKENRNGDDTQGVYTVLLPDGRKQIVHYTANSDGYKPTITYEASSGKGGYDQGYQY